MAKRKPNKPIDQRTIPQRRSIPVKDVEQLVDRAIRDVKASLTIYDDRLEVLRSLEQHAV